MEKKQRNRKNDHAEMHVKKKTKLEWPWQDCAHAIGTLIKFTGVGKNKKYHYKTFEFHGTKYQLEDSVMLTPEDINRKPYIAIIKDIYIQGKEGYVKIEVQWFYRPEDVDKKYLTNWKSKDSSDLFYSFHRDEVFAESVMYKCTVDFVPENEQIPNRSKYPEFIVQTVYDIVKKKLQKFDSSSFNKIQKNEIDLLVAKTTSRVGHLRDNEKDKKVLKSRRKQSFPERFIKKVERTSRENSNVVNASLDILGQFLEKFDT